MRKVLLSGVLAAIGCLAVLLPSATAEAGIFGNRVVVRSRPVVVRSFRAPVVVRQRAFVAPAVVAPAVVAPAVVVPSYQPQAILIAP